MTPIRVLVADGLPVVGAGVRILLSRAADFEVIEAHNLDDALLELAVAPVEIALVDLDLPPAGGVTAVRRFAAEYPALRTIVWSLQPPGEVVLAAIRAGASGFLHKEVSPDGLLRALRGITQGEAPLSRNLAGVVIEALHGHDDRARARELAARLSDRERQVLMMVARGSRNREIAELLTISEFTVKRHVQNILRKLELASRTAAGSFYRSAFGIDEPYAQVYGGAV